MKNKRKRLQIISEILKSNVVSSQDDLLSLLAKQDCEVTQATLSRDLKQLKVAKTPLANGTYKYILPPVNQPVVEGGTSNFFSGGTILSVEFSGQLAVIKTKPGYASAIAWDIDNEAKYEVLGTIAGDDTILLIPREGISRQKIMEILNLTFKDDK
ncbi:ArgR family transcriptional regulator [Paludibacter sp. 221]|uniref:arginine repressor n=1 Tax=Paludibacter sp. 221 TaxID=2302939 RepID=UPI0013CFDC27|nr:ArgR family transcriptional regulator [Paludibacter sp. 221]NDV45612.1 ArgR family transcriptional regulator [Paludibacter sp. 221]